MSKEQDVVECVVQESYISGTCVLWQAVIQPCEVFISLANHPLMIILIKSHFHLIFRFTKICTFQTQKKYSLKKFGGYI